MKEILTSEEIENENLRMRLEGNTLVLLNQYPKTIERKKLIELLQDDIIPKNNVPKDILENRNFKTIPAVISVESGITNRRTTLKYLPTHQEFYSSPIIEENVATELPYATTFLILHQSLDKEWYYIQCSFYRGWISMKDTTIIQEQERVLFENPDKFIVITTPLVPFANTLLDLGTKLPVLGVHETSYEIFVPAEKEIQICSFPKENCTFGYLPYTRENILSLAYKCIGIPYQWGGKNNGLDCSLFIFTLFRTFGLLFPRDAKNQEKIVGIKKIDLKGKTEVEKKEILNTLEYPAILHKKGHVLLAISSTDVIHAYGDAKKVILSTLECLGTNLYSFITSVSILIK